MARKTKVLTLTDAGRDTGKRFLITEFPARRAHQWASRALFGLLNGGVDIPENIADMGMAGLAVVGVRALGALSPTVGIPLANELLEAVTLIPDPNRPEVTRGLIDDDVEEVATYFKLQREALEIHLNFSTPAAPSTSG